MCAQEDDVRNLVDRTVARFGRLDVAVNNAGTEGQPGPLTEQSAETYADDRSTRTCSASCSSLKHELRAMYPQKRGSIIISRRSSRQFGLAGGVDLRRQQACGGRSAVRALEAADRRARECGLRPGRSKRPC